MSVTPPPPVPPKGYWGVGVTDLRGGDAVKMVLDLSIKAIQTLKTIKSLFSGFFNELTEKYISFTKRWIKDSES